MVEDGLETRAKIGWTMSKHHIIYHNDADGYASAAIAYRFLTMEKDNRVPEDDVVFHPFTYGMRFPGEIDRMRDLVYILDFSFQPEGLMVELAEDFGGRLVWIDHHQTSLDAEEEHHELGRVPGMRRVVWSESVPDPISGCELAWAHFFMLDNPPFVIRMIGDWDVWRWKEKDELTQKYVQGLQYYLKASGADPKDDHALGMWLGMMELTKTDIVRSCCEPGIKVMEYQKREWRKMMGERSFEATFAGMNAIVVNEKGNSTMFDGFYDPEKHTVMVAFHMTGLNVTVSMYTEKTEDLRLGRIAKSLGEKAGSKSGGGHAGAAGFQCDLQFFEKICQVK